jgi:serine/threonine protein kinase/tetratricopeptide (TPR) repeat protein
VKAGDSLAGRFEILSRADAGAMGVIFRARDIASNQLVAVKVLSRESARAVARFERESRVLAELSQLAHSGIVRYIDQGLAESGEPYLVMEWLEGENLAHRLARVGSLDVEQSIDLVTGVASALSVAHARGMVHRDIKPSNIFLVGDRAEWAQVKLLDFGLARLEEAPALTRDRAVLGTPSYMAPEQVQGESSIDARADVFALGCVLFECLTGQKAFAGETLMAIWAKILWAPSPTIRAYVPGIPQEFEELVAWMLNKNPDQRPRDSGEVVAALTTLGSLSAGTVPPWIRATTRGLTESEQHSFCVLLIEASNSEPFARDSLQQVVEVFRASMQVMLDGSAVVVLEGEGAVSDLAASAARLALAMREHLGKRPMALSMSREQRQSGNRTQTSGTIDAAASLLASPRWSAPSSTTSEEGPIRLDAATAGLLDARFDVRESDSGFLLFGERPLAEGRRPLLGRATTCVGREREFALLQQMFDDCIDEGWPQAALITGQVGMGKSRLAYECVQRAKDRCEGLALWIGRGDSLRAGSALGLLGQALRGACGLLDGEPLELRRSKLRARVAEHVPAAERVRIAEFLGEIVGTPMPDEDSVTLRAARNDPQLLGDQMREAWADFVAAECRAQPVILVLEDLHWGDSATVRFVDWVLRRRDGMRLLVLALARPDVHDLFPRLWAERSCQEIRLRELSPRACERLIRQVLGPDLSAERVARIVELADGNAFHLEELIRATAERAAEKLPETVVAMVQSRLAALEPGSRRILRAASIFGETVWSGGISALLGGEDVREGMALLVEREILRPRLSSRFAGEEEFGFRHELLREGAYAMLTEADRVLGHRLAGQWLQAHGECEALVLAEHFERGGMLEQAAAHYLRAAQLLLAGGGDWQSIRTRVQQGLACVETGDTRIALMGVFCEVAIWTPNAFAEAIQYAKQMQHLVVPGSEAWAHALSMLLLTSLAQDDMRVFRGLLDEFRPEVVIAREAIAPMCIGLSSVVYVISVMGQLDLAEEVLGHALAIASLHDDEDPVASAYLMLLQGTLDAYVGNDPWSSLGQLQQASDCFQAIGHRQFMAGTSIIIACISLWLGLFAEAEQELECNAASDYDMARLGPLARVALLSHRGAHHEAVDVATRMIESGADRSRAMYIRRAHWALADALFAAGELERAEWQAQHARELLTRFRVDHIAVSATLAAIQLAAGRSEEALATAEQALAEYDNIGACGFFRGPYLRVVHIEALLATGREAQAREAIAVARQKLLAIADRIKNPYCRASFLENVPENVRTLELARRYPAAVST